MLLEDSHIYPYIKEYLEEIPVIKASKGEIISKAENTDKQIYYILLGTVKIECISTYGKKVLVDIISENEFAGQISYMRKFNFYSDCIAETDVELLFISNEIMSVLMKGYEFSTFFYFKTSSRVYQMYKKMLMNNLFNQNELVSYYIVNQSNEDKFIYKSIYDMCEKLNISRRSLYNILNNLEKNDVIEKEQNGIFLIRDIDYLIKDSCKVKAFLENEY